MSWGTFIGLAATLIGGWLGHRITKPKDADKAATLDRIARGAVAIIVAAFPKADWTKLLELAVDAISKAAGVPTTNKAAIERSAAAALTEVGKNPNAKTDPIARH